jgi:hypothetical protein
MPVDLGNNRATLPFRVIAPPRQMAEMGEEGYAVFVSTTGFWLRNL